MSLSRSMLVMLSKLKLSMTFPIDLPAYKEGYKFVQYQTAVFRVVTMHLDSCLLAILYSYSKLKNIIIQVVNNDQAFIILQNKT